MLKAARALLGWTQRELAEKAEIGSSTAGDFERGVRATEPQSLERIAATLLQAGVTWSISPEEISVRLRL
jgi:transcriptional regulator with XRE-family HTH domain